MGNSGFRRLQQAVSTSLLAAMIWFSTAALLVNTPSQASDLPAHMEGQLIIGFKKGTPESAKQDLYKRFNLKPVDSLPSINAEVVSVPQSKSLEEWMRILKTVQYIRYAEPNYELKLSAAPPPAVNDPYFPQLWGLHNTAQAKGYTADADIDAPEAWTLYKPVGTVVVAVIDTGVSYPHKDLSTNIWCNNRERRTNVCTPTLKTNKNKVDDDKNGFVDDTLGWDFVNNDNDPNDDNGHGTHVSGTIAGISNNKYGIAGVAGQGYVRIMPLKFLDRRGSGYLSNAVKAIAYATANGAKVASNSWGGPAGMQSMYDAIAQFKNAGGLFIVAAGNNGSSLNSRPSYPAAYTISNIISVAATGPDNKLAYFSNYSPTLVHLAAPGVNILSTFPSNKFTSMNGTSMATPHVSGVAALIWSHNPSLSADQVKNILLTTVTPVSGLSGYTSTGGVVNAEAAIKAAN